MRLPMSSLAPFAFFVLLFLREATSALLPPSHQVPLCFAHQRPDVVRAKFRTRPLRESNTDTPSNSPNQYESSAGASSSKENDISSRRRLALKGKLFAAAASVDRGFAAFPNSPERANIDRLINKLCDLNPTAVPTAGLLGSTTPADSSNPPLEGTWKLVYTTAYDVLSLGLSPFTAVEGIYQDLDRNGPSVNVIDLCPRFQIGIPFGNLSSSVRLKVKTFARARSDRRVGLSFEGGDAGPTKVLGIDVGDWVPRVGGNFPTLSGFGITNLPQFGAGEEAGMEGPGYFDVMYVDEDTLIITQNEPGGLFVSVKETDRIGR